MQYAVAQLARREHSRAELRSKLQRRGRAQGDTGADPALVEGVLDQLQSKGLLSDARFAALLTRSRASRFGAARIRAEMREHDLPDEVTRPAMEQLKATEEQRARALWQRRFGRAAADATERAKQMRFLAQRGFSAAVVLRIVKSAGADE
jgi:regulatory protein